jgi:MFS family permease
MNTGETPDIPDDLTHRVLRHLLPAISIAFLLNYLDRFNISFAGLQMEESLGLSPVGFGWAGSCFAIGYLLFQIPANIGLMRIGARRWLGILAIGWGLIVCLTGLVRTPTELYAARFLLGAVEAGFVPAIVLYLSWWFPTRMRTQTVAIYGQGVPIAGIIGGPLAGWLMTVFATPAESESWRTLMFCEGAPSILVGLWMLATLPNAPREARWLSETEAAEIAAASTLAGASPRPVDRAQILITLRSPAVWRLCVTYFLLVGGTFGIVLWLPQFLRRPGWESPQVIGWISAIPWAFGSVSIVVASRMADRSRDFGRVAAISAVSAAVAFGLAGIVQDRWLVLSLMTIATASMLSLSVTFWGLPPEVLAGEKAAVGIPLVNAAGFAGALFSPVAIGWIAQSLGSLSGGIILSGVFLAGCAVALIGWRREFRVPCSRT